MAVVNPEVVTGALLKQLIKESPLSISEVAGKLDKTRSALLAALKCSNAKPSGDEVDAILQMLNVPRDGYELHRKIISDCLEREFGITQQIKQEVINGSQRKQVRDIVEHIYVKRSRVPYLPSALRYQPVC